MLMGIMVSSIIKNLLKSIFRNSCMVRGGTTEKMAVMEQVEIKIIRDGKVVKTIKKKGHTWTMFGLTQIVKKWIGQTCEEATKIKIWNSTTSGATVVYTCSDLIKTFSTVNNNPCFIYSYMVGTESSFDVGKMTLESDANNTLSEVVVNGTKMQGLELIIEWKNILTGG